MFSQFARGPPRENLQVEEKEGQPSEINEEHMMGCAPYLQLFKAGKLVYTSAATLHVQQSQEELPFVQVIDGTVPFNINEIIQGDILIRCRHLTLKKKRISMFRAAFHTGYAPPNVLRLTKAQLDGACNDDRYPDNFFLDLIFEKVDAETLTKHLEESGEDQVEDADNKGKGGPVVKASKFDSMLQGDSRFWDVINSKKQEHMKQKPDDPFWGPTVGRRRGGEAKKPTDEEAGQNRPPNERSHMETFSIGNEFDFLSHEKEEKTPQRDSLMDALNALEEDETMQPDADSGEINFEASESESHEPIFSDDSASNQPADDKAQKLEKESEKEISPHPSADLPVSNEANDSESLVTDQVENIDDLLAVADEDFGDLDLGDLDDEDGDIEDLESLLNI